MLQVKFMSLSGKFETVRTAEFADMTAARAAVEEHAKTGGYTNVKPIDDADSIRYTARTPGGRGGRNIAFCDYMDDYSAGQS